MKKIITFVMVLVMIFAVSTVVFAADTEDDGWKYYSGGVDAVNGTTPAVTTPSVSVPALDEGLTEEEKGEVVLTTEKIVGYVQDHLEEITVIVTLIVTLFMQLYKHGLLTKSIGTLNNNAVTVAEKSTASMADASNVINGYISEMSRLLEEVRANAEEKKLLQQSVNDTQTFLKSAKLANMELSNELAELLVLANIPNSKKEELYARHLAAVKAISDGEAEAEVVANVGEEA